MKNGDFPLFHSSFSLVTRSLSYVSVCLSRGWGFCLDDRPSKRDLTTPLAHLGVRYTTHHQCQLQYGPNATFCREVDVSIGSTSESEGQRYFRDKSLSLTSFSQNVCQILWCSVNGSCRSKLDSPIDGTRCGPGKVRDTSFFTLDFINVWVALVLCFENLM